MRDVKSLSFCHSKYFSIPQIRSSQSISKIHLSSKQLTYAIQLAAPLAARTVEFGSRGVQGPVQGHPGDLHPQRDVIDGVPEGPHHRPAGVGDLRLTGDRLRALSVTHLQQVPLHRQAAGWRDGRRSDGRDDETGGVSDWRGIRREGYQTGGVSDGRDDKTGGVSDGRDGETGGMIRREGCQSGGMTRWEGWRDGRDDKTGGVSDGKDDVTGGKSDGRDDKTGGISDEKDDRTGGVAQ